MDSIFDPIGDGNCGFWCIAQAVFGDQERWSQVRLEMATFLEKEKSNFTKIPGGNDQFLKILNNVKAIDSKIKKTHWLSKLDMGQLAADTFKRPISFISIHESHCYVPFNVGPSGLSLISLCFVNENHWVLLLPKSDLFPIPPFLKVPKSLNKNVVKWKKELCDSMLLNTKK